MAVPVRHFVNDHRGGLGRYVELLVAAQVEQGSKDLAVFGPSRLKLPNGVGRDVYDDSYRFWGVNQWKFAVLAGSRNLRPTRTISHMHSLAFGPVDVQSVHTFYTRNWRARHANFFRVSPVARAQFELLTRLERNSLRKARIVVFASTECRRYAEEELGMPRSRRSVIIPQAVDSSIYVPLPLDQRDVKRTTHYPDLNSKARWLLFVGNDFDGKGLLRILDGMRTAKIAASPQVELLVFGTDPGNEFRARVSAQEIPGFRAHFLGGSPALRETYALCDALVMDSVSETGPLVMIEAMASGCVPFMTPCGSVRDTIQDGKNGRIFQESTSLARSVLETDSATLSAMSPKAVESVRDRTWKNVARAYEPIYAEIEAELRRT